MARAKKDGKFISCYIEKTLYDKLETYSVETKMPKTSVIEIALEHYLKEKNMEVEGN